MIGFTWREALAWGHSDDRNDTRRRPGGAEWQSRELDGACQRRTHIEAKPDWLLIRRHEFDSAAASSRDGRGSVKATSSSVRKLSVTALRHLFYILSWRALFYVQITGFGPSRLIDHDTAISLYGRPARRRAPIAHGLSTLRQKGVIRRDAGGSAYSGPGVICGGVRGVRAIGTEGS